MNLLKQGCISAKATLTGICFCFAISLSFGQIQKVRLDYTSPSGSVRQILLGFTPNNEASDGVDYGYDSAAWNYYDFDMNWMIGDYRYLIQGVGAFEETKTYPIGIFLAETSEVKISLNSLENFDTDIDVYIYDAENDTYHHINENPFTELVNAGDYTDRFFIAFYNPYSSQTTLGTDNFLLSKNHIKYLSKEKAIRLVANGRVAINSISIYSLNGQNIYSKVKIDSNTVSIAHLNLQSSPYILKIKTSQGILSKLIYI